MARKRSRTGDLRSLRKLLRRRFRQVKDQPRRGHHLKIRMRFFNLASFVGDPFLAAEAAADVEDEPALRETACRYLGALGWNERSEALLLSAVTNAVDDVGLFNVIQVLIAWHIGSPASIRRVRAVAHSIASEGTVRFLAALWLLAKYGSQADFDVLLASQARWWTGNHWVARQVAAVWPQLGPAARESLENAVRTFGLQDAALVLDNYRFLATTYLQLKAKAEPYLIAVAGEGRYPIGKFLTVLAILQRLPDQPLREELRRKVLAVVKDPVLRLRISGANP